MANFNHVIHYILDEEGGYVNDPRDPGGETNWGISKRAYPSLDIKNLKPEKAIEIYRRDYWDPVRGDDLPKGVDLLVLDCAVNQGVGVAARILQTACGAVADGKVGPKTLERIRSVAHDTLLSRIASLRALRYTETNNFDRFGKGWMNRLMTQLVRACK